MYRTNFIILFMLIPMSSVLSEMILNSSLSTTLSMPTLASCSYCQRMMCRCSSNRNTLNCSSYLLNLKLDLNCSQSRIWEHVDFSSRNLETLNSTSLSSLRMYRLILKSNSITFIHDNTFYSIGDVLIELDLQINQLSSISSKWFHSKLNQLKILNLASNQLESFTKYDHINLPYLQVLNLSRNQFEIIPYQIHQLKSLVKLDLSFNKLSSIPRFAFMGLNNLTWLSLASNRNLTCVIQDSFKYLASLKYLDLSSTNLFDLDGCIFLQLTGLITLKIERISINCSSCGLLYAKGKSITLFGECLNNNNKIQHLNTSTNDQIHYSCSKSSINCSSDYCEPGSYNYQYQYYSYEKLGDISDNVNNTKNRKIVIALSIAFSIITSFILTAIILTVYLWKQGKTLLCCDCLSSTSSTLNEVARRHRRQHQKQIINKNPTVIESVITHGANMNVPSYSSEYKDDYSSETTSNTKRKLYNPVFTDSPKSDTRYHQSEIESNDNKFHSNQMFSEDL